MDLPLQNECRHLLRIRYVSTDCAQASIICGLRWLFDHRVDFLVLGESIITGLFGCGCRERAAV